jgi:hypothetical protein
LGIWLFLFITAGDGWLLLRRQYVLERGVPIRAIVISKHRSGGKNYLYFECAGAKTKEPVGGKGFSSLNIGQDLHAHAFAGSAYLDDDLGYSGWKLWLFGGAFFALWAWAALRYRFG